jgi:hypothetical protein
MLQIGSEIYEFKTEMRAFKKPAPLLNAVKAVIGKDGQSRCLKNAQHWAATRKTGLWGAGKGKVNGVDTAVFLGAKGEEAVGDYLRLPRLDESTTHPERYDFKHPVDNKLIEVKTAAANDYYTTGLYKAQSLNWNGSMVWEHNDKPDAIKGLLCEYYIFCTAAESFNDWNVSIIGWITRDEILQKYSTLHDGKKRNDAGLCEWKNYEIPYKALQPMHSFVETNRTK